MKRDKETKRRKREQRQAKALPVYVYPVVGYVYVEGDK